MNNNPFNKDNKNSQSKWNIVDPFNETTIESRLTVGRYIDRSRTLMLLAVGNYEYLSLSDKEKHKSQITPRSMTYIIDVS